MGYVPRTDLEFALVKDHPRIKALRKKLDDWAAAQPDPTDEPAPPR